MGQAFDRDGEMLAEATGATKAEVLERLEKMAPDAHEVRIHTLAREEEAATRHIDKPFAYHNPSADGLKRITVLREQFSTVKRTIESTCPASRERSVAITELETAAMWAIKAVVFNDPASEVAS
jgi:hypothetical protein